MPRHKNQVRLKGQIVSKPTSTTKRRKKDGELFAATFCRLKTYSKSGYCYIWLSFLGKAAQKFERQGLRMGDYLDLEGELRTYRQKVTDTLTVDKVEVLVHDWDYVYLPPSKHMGKFDQTKDYQGWLEERQRLNDIAEMDMNKLWDLSRDLKVDRLFGYTETDGDSANTHKRDSGPSEDD